MTARAPGPTEVATEKAAWRRRIRAARRARLPEVRARHAALLTDAALELADGIDGPICAHLPVGVEPWSASGVEALRDGRARGAPARGGRPGGAARLVAVRRPGRAGRRPLRPAGSRPGCGSGRTPCAGPAWCCSPRWRRTGEECGSGQGGGFYDRTLPLVDADVPLVVVLDDGELVDALPAEPHDRRVTAALLPESGVTMLGGTD